MIAFLSILSYKARSDSCDVQDDFKSDCGFVGINQQQCEGKGCCWKPASGAGNIPWCYFKAGENVCENLTFQHTGGPGFTDNSYSQMYDFFFKNLNIQGKGGVVAAPDNSTPGGSYYYHWMRDSGLTMRLFIELNDYKLDKVDEYMKKYVEFVQRTNAENDPYGNDVRINPKFELPEGEVYQGGWCRPQTDGPALTAGALIVYGNVLLDNDKADYVKSDLWTNSDSKQGGSIYHNLDWVVNNWKQEGCDLWEEVRSDDFFWNRMAFVYSLRLGEAFAKRMGNDSIAQTYQTTRIAIEATLAGHWTGTYMKESENRPRDGAVTHAFSSFPGVYEFTDPKIAATIKNYNLMFCGIYPLNQDDIKAGIPGVLYGRYQGDSYAGGNPWQLLTAVLAKLMYQGAQVTMLQGMPEERLTAAQLEHWQDLYKLPANATRQDFVEAASQAGDAVMYRLYQHVKEDGGHVAEQIDKVNGKQKSANDLTWSYGNILDALKTGKEVKARQLQWRMGQMQAE